MSIKVLPLRVPIPHGGSVSAVLRVPEPATACLVFAHGAGAGMEHAFMTDMTAALEALGIATLRFQFPFMEQGSGRPDTPRNAHAAVRAAIGAAQDAIPGVPLFAGGKSYGGRMTSQAQAEQPLEGVLGLVFFGFPLHPAGKPSVGRAEHLDEVDLPMLFLQGTRDALADLDLIRQVTTGLGARATLHQVEGADHAFHVLMRSGRRDADVLQEMAEVAALWMNQHLTGSKQAPLGE